MMKSIDWIDLIIKIVIWILGIIAIYILTLKIIGHSLSVDDLQNIFIGIIITTLISMNFKLGKISARLDNFTNQFKALANDFKEQARRE